MVIDVASMTKIMISDAFLDLSKRKNIDKITVKDIVEICNITRQTFYYHFKDIMDVIEWSLEEKMSEIVEQSLQAESMEKSIRVLLSLVEENTDIINKLMNSQKRQLTERLLIDTMRSYMKEMIDRKELFMDMRRSDIKLALNFYSYAITGTLLEIGQKRKAIDLDLLSSKIYLLITGKIFNN